VAGGVLTGRGSDFIIIDDPLKPDEAVRNAAPCSQLVNQAAAGALSALPRLTALAHDAEAQNVPDNQLQNLGESDRDVMQGISR
jgi:hypothetical protein